MSQLIEQIIIIKIPSFVNPPKVVGNGKIWRSTSYAIMMLKDTDGILHFVNHFRDLIDTFLLILLLVNHICIKLHRSMVLPRKVSDHLFEVWSGRVKPCPIAYILTVWI